MITRFAPSPTGPLHLGHAYSAILAHDMALAEGGDFLLRIEDIDRSRARPEWEEMIYDDLRWLGLSWEEPVMRQSERMEAYSDALDLLWNKGLLFPCTCNRRDIVAAASAPNEGELLSGPDGVIYPGTCRSKPRPRQRPRDAALRLDMGRIARPQSGDYIMIENFCEAGSGTPYLFDFEDWTLIHRVGDVVISRRDLGTSYHLSVVVDDAKQGVTDVVRGEDLQDATMIHVMLQYKLGLPQPTYHHHRLIRDDTGKRLAKRDDARAIRTYREDGASPADIRRLVGL